MLKKAKTAKIKSTYKESKDCETKVCGYENQALQKESAGKKKKQEKNNNNKTNTAEIKSASEESRDSESEANR